MEGGEWGTSVLVSAIKKCILIDMPRPFFIMCIMTNAHNANVCIPFLICFINLFIEQTFSIPTIFHGTFHMVSEYNMVKPQTSCATGRGHV